MARLGTAWPGAAWCGWAGKYGAGLGEAGLVRAWQAWRVWARLGLAGYGTAGVARYGRAWLVEAWHHMAGRAGQGMAGPGPARWGKSWRGRRGWAWLGSSWLGGAGVARQVLARQGVSWRGVATQGTEILCGGVVKPHFLPLNLHNYLDTLANLPVHLASKYYGYFQSVTKTQHKYGRTLRAMRSARSLSLSALAKKSGIHHTVLSRLETGSREPRTSHLQKLAVAFRISMSGLVKKLENG